MKADEMNEPSLPSIFILYPLSFILHPSSFILSPTNADCHWNDTDVYGARRRIMETRLGVYLHAGFSNPVGEPAADIGAEYVISLYTDRCIDRHQAINTSRHPPIPGRYARLAGGDRRSAQRGSYTIPSATSDNVSVESVMEGWRLHHQVPRKRKEIAAGM